MLRWQRDDRQAGSVLIDRHLVSVVRFFESMVDHSTAADLTQETLFAVAASRHNFAGRSSFRTYLFSIARHKLYDFFRRKTRRSGLNFDEISVADVLADAKSPVSEVARKQKQRDLLRHLRTLPVKMQLSVMLYYWEGLSVKEIAEVLDVPLGTSKRRLQRARELLEQRLAKAGLHAKEITTTLNDLEGWRSRLLTQVRG